MAFWKKKLEEESSSTKSDANAGGKDTPAKAGLSPDAGTGEPSVLGGAKKDPSTSSTAAASKSSSTDNSSGTTPSYSASPSAGAGQSKDLIEDRFGVVRSALGPGTVIQGKLSFDTPVRIDGKLTGDIFSSQALIVGEGGEIDANVEVACLIVMGKVRGKITATERIELWAGGKLEGEISTPVFMMEDTAVFNGACKMGASVKGATKSPEKSQGADTKDSNHKSGADSKKGDEHKEVRVH